MTKQGHGHGHSHGLVHESIKRSRDGLRPVGLSAFELQILYDKAERKVKISATVSEAVAAAFENKKALPKEGFRVLLKEVAGAGFEPATFGL